MQAPPSHDTNPNYSPINYPIVSSSQQSSNNPSPRTPTAPPTMTEAAGPSKGLRHRRCLSDSGFWNGGAEELGISGDTGSEDDLISAYLDLEKIGGTEDDGGVSCLMEHDGSGGIGGEAEKGVRRSNRYGDLLGGLGGGGGGGGEFVSYEAKKAIPPEKLAEMWAVDPKRVKRILANRQSAARSKERKARYVLGLERKVQSLHAEATNLSVQLRIYQRDTTNLISENVELKIRFQAMEQQAHFRDAVNEALKQEVERLKATTGEMRTPGSDSLSLRMAYSPKPSPTTLQTVSSSAASPSPHTTANLFPLPKKTVPLLAQLPPFHNFPASRRHPTNQLVPPEQNESLSRLKRLDIGSRNFANVESPLVSPGNDHSSSTRQLMTP